MPPVMQVCLNPQPSRNLLVTDAGGGEWIRFSNLMTILWVPACATDDCNQIGIIKFINYIDSHFFLQKIKNLIKIYWLWWLLIFRLSEFNLFLLTSVLNKLLVLKINLCIPYTTSRRIFWVKRVRIVLDILIPNIWVDAMPEGYGIVENLSRRAIKTCGMQYRRYHTPRFTSELHLNTQKWKNKSFVFVTDCRKL